MKPKILLVNPYIEDFAAYDHFSKPYGLLLLAGYLRKKFDLRFANALRRGPELKTRPDGTGEFPHVEIAKPSAVRDVPRKFKRYGAPEADFVTEVDRERPDYVFVTSGMTYWYTGLAHTVRLVREALPGVPVAVGGIYATLMTDHLNEAVAPDLTVAGQEPTDVLAQISRFTGIDIAADGEPDPAYDLLGEYRYLPVMTSLGCVLRCDYCSSPRLCKYRQFDPVAVARLVEKCVRLYSVNRFAFYDDALLYRSESHLDVLLWYILENNVPVRFYTPNGLHARFLTLETARLMKQAGFEDVRLSLESSLASFHDAEDGKISLSEFERAIDYLKSAGFGRKAISVYTLVNMPGQDAESVRDTMEYIHRLGASPRLAYYSPIYGTPDFGKAAKITDLSDPLSHNNTVYSYRCGTPVQTLNDLKLLEISYRRE
jgi:radical SAM superfamily enzyme YgiQ (UPF0313 family)